MKFFALCVKPIALHGKTAFHRGHVYIAERPEVNKRMPEFNWNITSDQDTLESFPNEYFTEHFTVMHW